MSSDCFDPVVEVNKRDTSCTGGTGRHNQASLNPPVPVFMLNWVDHLPVLASYLTHRWEWHQSSNLTLCYNVNKHIAKSISCFLLMRHRGSISQFALLKENMKMCEFSMCLIRFVWVKLLQSLSGRRWVAIVKQIKFMKTQKIQGSPCWWPYFFNLLWRWLGYWRLNSVPF